MRIKGINKDCAWCSVLKRGEEMKSEYIFPTVLIVLDVLAAIPYGVKCNIRMMVYWLSAATLTACVTYK